MIYRRTFLKIAATQSIVFGTWPLLAAERQALITKKIPSTQEAIPVIGMGTWQTFNVGSDTQLMDARTEVLNTFLASGGQVIDSSPMYGSAQDLLGYGLKKLGNPKHFSADKIWTRSGTVKDFEASRARWAIPRFDLMAVHNLLSWEEHLPKLQEFKKQGKIRYVGITTSHGRRHSDLEKIMKTHDLDFVQLTYNIADREVEKRLLPLAAERNIAVMANRPFKGGDLTNRLKGKKPLPAVARDMGITNWPQFLLKFVVSHPSVTIAIPATSRVDHMRENMSACYGELPDAKTRAAMLKAFEAL